MTAPIQQGDILLVPLPPTYSPPAEGGVFVDRDAHGRLVFASGATGHVHCLDRDDPGSAATYVGFAGYPILVVPEGGTTLRHLDAATGVPTQDHVAVPIPPGIWEVRRQREVRWGESLVVED